jgi:hypothetical protein
LPEYYKFWDHTAKNEIVVKQTGHAPILEWTGPGLDNSQGKLFWETYWWQVLKATQDYQRDRVARSQRPELAALCRRYAQPTSRERDTHHATY